MWRTNTGNNKIRWWIMNSDSDVTCRLRLQQILDYLSPVESCRVQYLNIYFSLCVCLFVCCSVCLWHNMFMFVCTGHYSSSPWKVSGKFLLLFVLWRAKRPLTSDVKSLSQHGVLAQVLIHQFTVRHIDQVETVLVLRPPGWSRFSV